MRGRKKFKPVYEIKQKYCSNCGMYKFHYSFAQSRFYCITCEREQIDKMLSKKKESETNNEGDN